MNIGYSACEIFTHYTSHLRPRVTLLPYFHTSGREMDPNYIAIEFLCPVCNTLPINGAVLAEDGVSETNENTSLCD